ncbi:MAG TPA: DegT/DnrJ/EryC1/StrS family aminotransferase, partial [Chthoniobacterales bacterium]|nr:DegT/DnrJ/EryC1/StrS family aminotransferase [Chthoniobacterales bacterium]
MRVPLLDLAEQHRTLAGQLRGEIDQILATQNFILGRKVEAFEKAIADYCGARHAIGISSGTDALLAILMAMEIGPGDAVITTPFTFFATGGCVARLGATPVFVDIDADTYNISAAALEAYFATCKRQTDGTLHDAAGRAVRAIVPVHLFGLCCDMDAIIDIADRAGVPVIEDAAQAIGAEYPSRTGAKQAGTMGLAGSFSFYPSKNLGAAGDAGLITSNDGALAHRIRICRQHGMEPRYFHHFVGGNFRLDEIQAAVLRVKLPHLDGWSAARRRVAEVYREEFMRRGLTAHLRLPIEPYRDRGLTNHHIYHQFVVATAQREALREHLTRKQIGTAIYYPLGLHQQQCFAYLGYREGDFPETERAARETLALPIYPELAREGQLYVVDAIEEFF